MSLTVCALWICGLCVVSDTGRRGLSHEVECKSARAFGSCTRVATNQRVRDQMKPKTDLESGVVSL